MNYEEHEELFFVLFLLLRALRVSVRLKETEWTE
jgi:hypothetical protein